MATATYAYFIIRPGSRFCSGNPTTKWTAKVEMCLVIFAYRYQPGYRLIVAANRDEYYARPSSPAAFWGDSPDVLAGRDLQEMGTWMGITRTGRFAALTNFRDPTKVRSGRRSRGELVSRFLRGTETPEKYLKDIRRGGVAYNGFNLLVGDCNSLWYYSNQADQVVLLEPGVYGLSNHLLDTPWPKVSIAKTNLTEHLAESTEVTPGPLLEMLSDRSIPPDNCLPDTGVGLERERMLAPIYIDGTEYGTRASTALTVTETGFVSFVERTGDRDAVFDFAIPDWGCCRRPD